MYVGISGQERLDTRHFVLPQSLEHHVYIRPGELRHRSELGFERVLTDFHLRVIGKVLAQIVIHIDMKEQDHPEDSECQRAEKQYVMSSSFQNLNSN